MKKYSLILFLSVFMFSAWAEAATSFFQIIIDQTGSMVQTRSSTGNNRYQDAISQAQGDLGRAIQEANDTGGELLVAVAAFNSSIGFDQKVDFVDAGTALVTLNGLRALPPSAATPLADALCSGAVELSAESSIDSYTRVIGFYTDLDENASTGPCSGTDWIAKVIAKFFSVSPISVFNVTLFATVDDLTVSRKMFNVNQIEMDINPAMKEQSNLYESAGVKVPKLLTTIEDEVAFMQALASYTGGNVVGFADTLTDPVIDTTSGCGIFFPCTP